MVTGFGSTMKDLFVFHDDNGTFLDVSSQARTYIQDDFQLQYTAAEDAIYVGLFKPFYSLYPQINTVNTASTSLAIQYWNGSSYVPATLLQEETNTLNRGGLVTWQRDLDDWATSTINGQEAYWIRVDLTDCDLIFAGLNILYSSDADLKKEQFDINNHLPKGVDSFAHFHEAARDEIIQRFRNQGKATYSDNRFNNFSKWDIIDVDEIRQASKYLVLGKIMFDASTEVDDKYYQKHRDYMEMFGAAFKLYFISWDKDNDGAEDINERLGIRSVEFTKV